MAPSFIIGLFVVVLLGILVGYTVPTLIQIRKTARAAEEFLKGMTPRIESATSNLDSVLGRLDRVMRGMEDGTRGLSGAIGGMGDFLSFLKPPGRKEGSSSGILAALASVVAGFSQAWSLMTGGRPAPAAGEGGTQHE
ncbi:MAG: hypothetical protein HY049_07545 [Acidobacteria bacterium]|nr:hypothetical protein [Acidobacteriota bacterium]